jgi:DNA-binding transcriptional LysR family regulator
MLDLNALRDFVSVIREGGFSAASRALRVPKSTLSKRIQALEAALDSKLIERTTRSLRLTPEGSGFHARALKIIEQTEEAEAFLKDRSETPKGHLRISSPQLFGQLYLGEIAAAYHARYPETTLDIVLADRAVDLIEEGFDAAIRIGPLPDSSLVARVIATAENVVVASAALFSQRDAPTRPEDLASHSILAFGSAGAASPVWRLHKGEEEIVVPITPSITMNSLLTLKQAALTGAGLAMLPRFIVAEDLAAGRLVSVLGDWVGPSAPVSIVYPSSRLLNIRMRAFIDLVVARFPERRLAA